MAYWNIKVIEPFKCRYCSEDRNSRKDLGNKVKITCGQCGYTWSVEKGVAEMLERDYDELLELMDVNTQRIRY
jgi:hypothetical protein